MEYHRLIAIRRMGDRASGGCRGGYEGRQNHTIVRMQRLRRASKPPSHMHSEIVRKDIYGVDTTSCTRAEDTKAINVTLAPRAEVAAEVTEGVSTTLFHTRGGNRGYQHHPRTRGSCGGRQTHPLARVRRLQRASNTHLGNSFPAVLTQLSCIIQPREPAGLRTQNYHKPTGVRRLWNGASVAVRRLLRKAQRGASSHSHACWDVPNANRAMYVMQCQWMGQKS